MRIAVVTAGLGTPSSTRVLADELAAAVRTELGPETDVDVIELREHAHALVDNLLTGFPGPPLREALDAVADADGLIAVTPVFTASYSALFKAFFDVLDPETLVGKPVLMAATGGTERHSLALEHALRPLFGHLRAHTAPTAVYAATGDFGADGSGRAELESRIARAAREFAALVVAFEGARPADPWADPVPFEQLLGGRTR